MINLLVDDLKTYLEDKLSQFSLETKKGRKSVKIVKYFLSSKRKETGRRFTSKEVTSLKKDYDINVGLFNFAERIYQIKQPESIEAFAA